MSTTPRLDDIPYQGQALAMLVELSTQLKASLLEQLADQGLTDDKAQEAADEAAFAVLCQWGGTSVYFPQAIVTGEKHWQIYQEWKGNNERELAKKFGFTPRWIRRIIKHMRKVDMQRRQGDIFGQEG